MTKDEALRFLAGAAEIKHDIQVPEIYRHNARVAEAVNTLAIYLGLNIEIKDPSSPPRSEDRK